MQPTDLTTLTMTATTPRGLRTVKPSWLTRPHLRFWQLFHPPLPTAFEVVQQGVGSAHAEIDNAQRELAKLEFQKEVHQGVIEMNRRRLRRLDHDLQTLQNTGELRPFNDAVTTPSNAAGKVAAISSAGRG